MNQSREYDLGLVRLFGKFRLVTRFGRNRGGLPIRFRPAEEGLSRKVSAGKSGTRDTPRPPPSGNSIVVYLEVLSLYHCLRNTDLTPFIPLSDHYLNELRPKITSHHVMEASSSWVESNASCDSEGIAKDALDPHLDEQLRGPLEPRPPLPVPEFQYREPPEKKEVEIATRNGDFAAVKSIIEKWRSEPENRQKSLEIFGSALSPAIEGLHIAIIVYLIENVTSLDDFDFRKAMDMESYVLMELMIDHGFDINQPWCDYYSSALAYSFKHEGMTLWLLDHGADPNAESWKNNTPLSRAVQYAPMSIIKLLFDRGGPECLDHGELLICATCRNLPNRIEVLEYLFTKGAQRDINKLEHEGRPYLFALENLIIGCDAPLHVAARTGKLDVVKFLVAHGADTRKPDGKGRLPIDRARKEHHDDVVQYLAPISVHQPKL